MLHWNTPVHYCFHYRKVFLTRGSLLHIQETSWLHNIQWVHSTDGTQNREIGDLLRHLFSFLDNDSVMVDWFANVSETFCPDNEDCKFL
jgi:hypothetical protein